MRDIVRSRAAIYVDRPARELVIDDGRPVRIPLDAATVAFLLAEIGRLASPPRYATKLPDISGTKTR